MTDQEYENFNADMEKMREGLVEKDPRILDLDNEIRGLVDTFEDMAASGATPEKIKEYIKSTNIHERTNGMCKEMENEAMESGEYKISAAYDLYGDIVEAQLTGIAMKYGLGLELM